MRDRRALLTAALGFLQLRQTPPELVPLRRWLDSWRGVGAIVTGLNAQGLDLELRQFPRGWRANLYPTGTAHSIVVACRYRGRRCSRQGGRPCRDLIRREHQVMAEPVIAATEWLWATRTGRGAQVFRLADGRITPCRTSIGP